MRARPQSALAAILMLVALAGVQLTASASPAAAQGPNTRLHGHLPVNGGVGLLLWDGGLTLALIGEAERAGCSVAGLYVNRPDGGGGLLSYIPGARIRAVNRPYLQAFPSGLLDSTPVLVLCRPHIQGVVLDTAGRPFAGATIAAWHVYPLQNEPYVAESAADGSFDIVVDRGTYRLGIYTPGAAQSGWYVPGGLTTERRQATELTMRSSGVTDIVIGLQPAFPISGVVLASDGSPLSGIGVFAERQPGVPISGRYETRSDGRFVVHVAGEEPATVGLRRQHSRNSPWLSSGWYGPGGYTARKSDVRQIVPGSPEATDIEIILPPFRTVAGLVRGPDGPPPRSMLVRAYVDSIYFVDLTSPNGAFSVTLPQGRVRISLEGIAESGAERRSAVIGWYGSEGLTTASSRLSEIDLRSGDVDGLDLRITALRQISGYIRQPDTDSPKPVQLALFAHVDGSEDYLSSLLVGDDGKFSLPVMDGRYSLAIRVFEDGRFRRAATHDVITGITYACERLVPFDIDGDARGVEITLPGTDCGRP